MLAVMSCMLSKQSLPDELKSIKPPEQPAEKVILNISCMYPITGTVIPLASKSMI